MMASKTYSSQLKFVKICRDFNIFMPQVFLRKGIASGLVCACISMAINGGDARAVIVEVDGSSYDVSAFTGSYNNNQALLQSQIWYGNLNLAQRFADQVAAVTTQFSGLNSGQGLYYLYGISTIPNTLHDPFDPNSGPEVIDIVNSATYCPNFCPSVPMLQVDSFSYAIAQLQAPAPSSVPGPLPLFGAMAGFGISRRLRARIQAFSPRRVGC